MAQPLDASTSVDDINLGLGLGGGADDQSAFDDLFIDASEEQLGSFAEMEHDQFDAEFFGMASL